MICPTVQSNWREHSTRRRYRCSSDLSAAAMAIILGEADLLLSSKDCRLVALKIISAVVQTVSDNIALDLNHESSPCRA